MKKSETKVQSMEFPWVFSQDMVTSNQRNNSKRIHEQKNLKSQDFDPLQENPKEPKLEQEQELGKERNQTRF